MAVWGTQQDNKTLKIVNKKAIKVHPMDAYIGKKIKARRSQIKMSQGELGKTIGVSFQQIQHHEKGVERVSARRLYDFAKTLNVEVNYFFDGYEESDSIQK